MKKTYKLIALITLVAVTGFILVQPTPVSSAGESTVSTLDQWKATSTPISAITQRVPNKLLVLTGYSAGCAQFTATGTLQSTGTNCGSGGGGTPAGSSGELQFNNAGAFGALTGSVVSGNNLKLVDSMLDLDGQTTPAKLRFTGMAIDATSDTGGIEEVLNHNDNAGNKQLVVRDITGASGASTGFRYLVGTAYIAGVDAVDNDGNTLRAVNVGNNTHGLSVGGEAHAYNVTLPAQLSVYGNDSKDLITLFNSTSGASKFKVDNTGNTILDGYLKTGEVRASDTGGLSFYTSDGASLIGNLGAANTTNATWYGNHNFDNVTASRVAQFGSSKTLESSSVTNTELGYLSGVTSAIQTQLDNKVSSQWVSSSTDIYFTTGRVGIGTTSPSQKLEVWGNLNVATSTATSTLFVNTATRRVGIGTTAPATPLHVVGQGYFSTSAAFGASSGVISDTGGIFSNGLSVAGLVIRGSDNYTSSSFTFKTDGAYAIQTGGSNTRLAIASGGNVGIGTSTPAAKLSVSGVAGTPSIFIVASSSNAQYFNVNSDGKIGIGTSTPSQKVDVNGGLRLDTTTSKPTCDSTARGTFWVEKGGAGVKDNVEVCAKDAADAYAWRTIY